MKIEPGQCALITGGASGIGLGMAQAFEAAGLKVTVADIDEAALEAAARQLSADALRVQFDVSSAESWSRALAEVEAKLGPVRLLCLNAGIGGPGRRVEEIPAEAFARVLDVNLFGLIHGLQAWLPAAKAAGDPRHVVLTASMSALRPTPGAGAYNVSKFAAMGLAETLRAELAGGAIGASILCPGMTDTAFMRNAVKRGDAQAGSAVETVLAKGMPPSAIGRRVLAAIEADEFYIFTHGDWREDVARRQADLLSAFGANADPGYREDVAGLLAASASRLARL
jgi:NAD(P)-dependent dehydrogenase (short-subunit alcohol dehydrogenase family)